MTERSPDKPAFCAYLDIETTGLDPSCGEVTVVGVCLDDGFEQKVVQLVGEEISAVQLLRVLGRVQVLYTYNGERFDLPYIRSKFRVDLSQNCAHRDLMYDCWKKSLFGGLKQVEKQLGIERVSAGIDGRMAVELWLHYKSDGDARSLTALLDYNREDVVNLKVLRQKLQV